MYDLFYLVCVVLDRVGFVLQRVMMRTVIPLWLYFSFNDGTTKTSALYSIYIPLKWQHLIIVHLTV